METITPHRCFGRVLPRVLQTIACLALTITLLTGLRAQASLVQAMDLPELVEQAELVVVARVMSQRSSYDERGRIVTDVQMQVERTEKGQVAPGSSIVVRRLGGVVDGLAMRIEGEPSFEDGELVLLFGSDPSKRSLLRPVGMSQGAMRIFEQAGERWVRSATRDLALVRKDKGTLAPRGPAMEEPRRLDDVLNEIRGLVAKSRKKK